MSQKTETKEANVLEFLFQEKEVHFLVNPNEKDVMINATEMAKMFGKRTSHYLNNETTKELISELELTDMSVNSDFKVLENRGHMGYYFCELLALDFAAWLDVKFKIWVYKTIKTILSSKTEKIAKSISQKQLKKQEEEAIIKKAMETNNTVALDLLKVQKEIKRADYQEKKAVNDLKSQYKINL